MEEKKNNLEAFVRAYRAGESLDAYIEDDEEPLRLETWSEIERYESPDDPWLVSNLVPREGFSILASVSGEGKSFLTMHLAKCIAEGLPLFGNESFSVKKSRVLYINLEMSKSEIKRRGQKLNLRENDNLRFINADDFNLNERIGQEDRKYKELLTHIYDEKISVVIIDTFRASAGGLKEEKAEEVRAYFQKFQLLKNSGVSLIFNEHVRKPTHLEGKKPKKEQLLGSQDKTANVEVLLMIHKDESSGDINVYQRKNRLGPEVRPFAVRMTDTIDFDGVARIELTYVGEIEEETKRKDEAKELILQILSESAGKTKKELGELIGKKVGDKNLRVALQELRLEGQIDYFKQKKAHCYFLKNDEREDPLGTEANLLHERGNISDTS